MDKREFWATKQRAPEWLTITFTHPQFSEPVRLVANEHADMVLGGQSYRACPMKITPPDQGKDPVSTLSVSFPRIIAGREFKARLRQITDAGRVDPIGVAFSHWIARDVPATTYNLYVSDDGGGISIGAEWITVRAADENPMRSDVSIVYDVDIWTGLVTI